MYSISTGEVESVDMIKTTANSGYGKYSQAYKDTYRLGVGWSYGLAKSLEMIAKKVADQGELMLIEIPNMDNNKISSASVAPINMVIIELAETIKAAVDINV